MPRVVIGSPLFNHAGEFREAIESILGQTYTDFALILLADRSTDASPDIAREYEAIDPRVSYQVNGERLGLVGNACAVFDLACARYPEAEYFAWASDHDLWHPRWLEQLVAALDAHPEVVLAYPLNRRIGKAGEVLARKPWAFDTFGIASRRMRLKRAILEMSAGNMVYGLYRVGMLRRAGVYRHVLVPDRLLFAELSLYGQFKQVPEVLWFRRWYGRIFSLGRQRRSFFPGRRRPLYAYFPWWISHAVSLGWTLSVRGDGRPEVSRADGALIALQVLVLNGLLHIWQTLRAIRGWILERLGALRPHERRARLVMRSIARRGPVDWTTAHVREFAGAKARRKMRARLGNRARGFGTEVGRRLGMPAISAVRSIPVVQRRVIPTLLKAQLDQVPVQPVLGELREELARLRASSAPIIIGPWISEVGFELLYWIPFLNWAITSEGLDARRLVVVSRGGAASWYRHLTSEYIDVFDLMTLEEYRRGNEERWAHAGHQKQFDVTKMEREILTRARARLGVERVESLHPSVMYRLLRYYWFGKASVSLLTKYSTFKSLSPPGVREELRHLPKEYVAVRFYFRPSFPDTLANRRFVSDVVGALSRQSAVVMLNTGLNLDDHEDVELDSAAQVYKVGHLMTPQSNLDLQTEIISRARAFVGTYGGLTYLGPFYGVPSVGFYSEASELIPSHLDVGWRLGRALGTRMAALNVTDIDLLRLLLAMPGGDWREEAVAPGHDRRDRIGQA